MEKKVKYFLHDYYFWFFFLIVLSSFFLSYIMIPRIEGSAEWNALSISLQVYDGFPDCRVRSSYIVSIVIMFYIYAECSQNR